MKFSRQIEINNFWTDGERQIAFDIVSRERFPILKLFSKHTKASEVRRWYTKTIGSPRRIPEKIWVTRIRCENMKVWEARRIFEFYARHGTFLLTLKAHWSK
jgi:hypothetical protein